MALINAVARCGVDVFDQMRLGSQCVCLGPIGPDKYIFRVRPSAKQMSNVIPFESELENPDW